MRIKKNTSALNVRYYRKAYGYAYNKVLRKKRAHACIKCAAGTGKFMEVIAQILETTIDSVGSLSLKATNPCDINSTCVVFAQSEVISLVARKYDRRDILAGMHLSMARRIIKMMKKSEKGGDILMTGGGYSFW